MRVGEIFACALIISNTSMRWDARAPSCKCTARAGRLDPNTLPACTRRCKLRKAACLPTARCLLQRVHGRLSRCSSSRDSRCLCHPSPKNPVLWASFCCALRSETCPHHAILPISWRHSEPDRGRQATTKDALPSLLAVLSRTLSQRICVSACECEP